ncbi:hypothetical protein L7F22_060645 [Adiantum nelumboides]|nr:hypothetical protein [Adiantum nelumboides]
MGETHAAEGPFEGPATPVTPLIEKLRLHVQGYVDKEDFLISLLKNEDVLLGAPWFHRMAASLTFPERKVTFKHKGRDITLHINEKGHTIPLVSHDSFDKAMKSSISAYMIFVKDLSNSNDVSPNGSLKVDNDLHSFLNEHAELFIDDIPTELPPKRGDDDHRIALILGSSPPNKPPYRVSQAQQEEIMSQVNELVQQGMVPPNAVYTVVQESKLLLKLAQPPNFKGEGVNVERDAEVWLEAMDDYFEAAGTHPQNQTMLAMFRLTGDAKIWWKTHCRDSDIIGASQTWEQIKDAVTARYLPPAHKATKMNEFFCLRQMSSTLEEYYSKFVTLRRYAPKMTLKQQVARFCQGLIEPLNNRLEALRPTNLQDALLRAKPLALEIQKTQQGRRNYLAKRARPNNWNNQPANHAYQNRPIVATTAAIELPNVRCYECQEYGHYQSKCPRRTRASGANATPVNAIAREQPNICGGRGRANRGRGRGAIARANAAIDQPTVRDETDERAVLHAAIDNPGAHQQFAIIQAPGTHQGEKVEFLIDCGSTHSFLSPRCMRKLKLNQYPANR